MKIQLKQLSKQLEALVLNNIPVCRALDLMERHAKDYKELVLINVMRESYGDIISEEQLVQAAG